MFRQRKTKNMEIHRKINQRAGMEAPRDIPRPLWPIASRSEWRKYRWDYLEPERVRFRNYLLGEMKKHIN